MEDFVEMKLPVSQTAERLSASRGYRIFSVCKCVGCYKFVKSLEKDAILRWMEMGVYVYMRLAYAVKCSSYK